MLPPPELIDITAVIPHVILDIRYASVSNFTGKQLYIHQLAWLRSEPLQKLSKAAEKLLDQGFQIVIFDAFRPPSVQLALRQVNPDTDYVMEVSNHCKGITVDITLADANGIYLDMGTDYDEFTPKSHTDSALITGQQSLNRQTLSNAMQAEGFVQHRHEWWHFDYQPYRPWELVHDEINTYKA